jgi:hypothetical protein
MKKLLLTVTALAALSGSAHANPKLQDLPASGFVCEHKYQRSQHATVLFDTQANAIYFQINAGRILKEPFEVYWSEPDQQFNEYGHVETTGSYHLSRVGWGTRQHAIENHQPSEFPGSTSRGLYIGNVDGGS